MSLRLRLFPKYATLIIALVGGMLVASGGISLEKQGSDHGFHSSPSRSLRQALESRLDEMFIEGKCDLNALAFHHDKRYAVGQGIAFVGLVGKFAPFLAKYRLVDVHKSDNAALEQYLSKCDRLGVMPAVIEECHDLVKHI